MLTVYRWGLVVFLAAGVVQIFLAGLGAFRLLHGAGDSALDPHRTLGFVMAGMAIVILILTLIARARWARHRGRGAAGVHDLRPAEPAGRTGRRSRCLRRPARHRWPAHPGHPGLPVRLVRAPGRMSAAARRQRGAAAAAAAAWALVVVLVLPGVVLQSSFAWRYMATGDAISCTSGRPAGGDPVRDTRGADRPPRGQRHRLVPAQRRRRHRHRVGSPPPTRYSAPQEPAHPAGCGPLAGLLAEWCVLAAHLRDRVHAAAFPDRAPAVPAVAPGRSGLPAAHRAGHDRDPAPSRADRPARSRRHLGDDHQPAWRALAAAVRDVRRDDQRPVGRFPRLAGGLDGWP